MLPSGHDHSLAGVVGQVLEAGPRRVLDGHQTLHDHGPTAVGRLGPLETGRQRDSDALGGPKAGVFELGGDALQRAQRTRDEQEHDGPPKGEKKMSEVGEARQHRISKTILPNKARGRKSPTVRSDAGGRKCRRKLSETASSR
jgi:hypothetical protein